MTTAQQQFDLVAYQPGLPGPACEAAWAQVGEALRQFAGPGGFSGPGWLLVGAGTR